MKASFVVVVSTVNSNKPIPPPCLMAMRVAQHSYLNGDVDGAIKWLIGALTPLLSSPYQGILASKLVGLPGNCTFCNALLDEANKGEDTFTNLDFLVLKTFLCVLDQSNLKFVSVCGIWSATCLIACMQDTVHYNVHYKGLPLDRVLHMRAILYARCHVFKQTRIDIKKAVKKLRLRGGIDAEMEAHCALWMDPIHKSKMAPCRECGEPAPKTCVRCHCAQYCSRACQETNWHKDHHKWCKGIKACLEMTKTTS